MGMRTLFTLPRFLEPSECQRLIREAEERGFTDAPITTSGGFVMMPEVRNNTRVMFDDVPLAMRLWAKLEPLLAGRSSPGALGLNERFRFYRYDPGQAFRWHRDGRFVRNIKEASRLTFMIYLNEGFAGGATEFDFPEEIVRPREGMALVFDHGLQHQGAEVTRGTKYVLRSDVMYSR
jgi:prolyl 4-hydroxylase